MKPCPNCTHPSAYVCQPGWPSGPELPVGEECPCECHHATEGDERPATGTLTMFDALGMPGDGKGGS